MASPDSRMITALLRFVTSRLNIPAVGIFRVDGIRTSLWCATDDFHHVWPRDGDNTLLSMDSRLPDWMETQLLHDETALFAPDDSCIPRKWVAAKPVSIDGYAKAFFLFLGDRRFWTEPEADEAMQDAADLLAPFLIDASSGASHLPPQIQIPATHSDLQPIVQTSPMPHSDALQMIRDMQSDAHGRGTSLMMLDIDRFRSINEALGSVAGDFLLARTAARLKRHADTQDQFARLSGDRFLLLTYKDGSELIEYGAALLKCIAAPLTVRNEPVTMQATAGVASISPGDELPAATLFMQADKALKRGKAEGGNRVCPHDPEHDAASQDRSRLELDLGAAIKTEQLRLVYQPYINLQDSSISGVEALLRWQHPGRGELTPGSFMTLAEASGQILPIGTWVLREALCRASEWPGGTRLAVNISALQFQQPDFIAQIDSALALSGFPADLLELEITETVLMRDDPETLGQVRTLIARGIRIALDDFGTGYSALSYLARLPHHRIKLDKSFIDDLGNPATSDVIQAIVASARAQGIAVTAEGIETEEQLEQARRMGFTHAQGYIIGLPVDDPAPLLHNHPFRRAMA